MMPGHHNHPSGLPHLSNRRQNEYPYHYSPQAHPYSPYQHQHPIYHPPAHPHAPHYVQQSWYPPYVPQQYSPTPRHFHPPPPQHHGPVIVSSHPPAMHPSTAPMPHAYRPVNSTPIIHPQTPAQPAPSTPSAASQAQASPTTPTTSVSAPTPPPPRSTTSISSQPAAAPLPTQRMPYYPKLPWYSVPEQPFPPRTYRRRKPRQVQSSETSLELPSREQAAPQTHEVDVQAGISEVSTGASRHDSQNNTVAAVHSDLETPMTSEAASEIDSTRPTTPASPTTPSASRPNSSTAVPRPVTRPAVPIIPVTPKAAATSSKAEADKQTGIPESDVVGSIKPAEEVAQNSDDTAIAPADEAKDAALSAQAPVPKAAPKSWADLVRVPGAAVLAPVTVPVNGATPAENLASKPKASSLPEAIRAFSVESASKVSFLEPRGLVNTGNMCYMNSILQILVFCVPFYDFLDQIGKKAVHSFKSDTPLLDAMIMFMREFKVIDAAPSVDQLRLRLKDNELEQYGDSFIPEFVYDVIRRLPRFATMKRGHQQDAEEFLGFLLEGLHDDCAQVLQGLPAQASEVSDVGSPVSERSTNAENGWLEVGPKQKSSITRSSGHVNLDSPVTKIFGGNLRSEFRVPGLKASVTLEPYQPLQLDISAPEVNNIIDALRGLTKSETLHGDFKSPRGPGTAATKQVFIETLPPVLILHLKRFHYDNTGGAQKIWKKIGYPLELSLPKEIFAPNKRSAMAISGVPKYRLLSVVYHHGKNANGGHYTVDVRRQDGKEWVRLDDTVIRRIRSEDVAEGGAEEDPKVLAKALEQHKRDTNNIYEQIEEGEDSHSESGGWSQVSTAAKEAGVKKWSAVANGTASPSTTGKRTPRYENVKDNKVAYILFYQKV